MKLDTQMRNLFHYHSSFFCLVVVLLALCLIYYVYGPNRSFSLTPNNLLPSNPHIYDTFSGKPYNLTDGQTSPNGRWKDVYNGFGSAGLMKDSDGKKVFYMYPATSHSENETHANHVRTTKQYHDFVLTLNMKTEKQLQENKAKPWQVGWILFRYVDKFHHYYFMLKTNGFELGKKDNNENLDKQIFLKTKLSNSTNAQVGNWQTVTIYVKGNHIVIWVNNVKIIDFTDSTMANIMKNGYIVLYDEDSLVKFDNVFITRI